MMDLKDEEVSFMVYIETKILAFNRTFAEWNAEKLLITNITNFPLLYDVKSDQPDDFTMQYQVGEVSPGR